MTNLRERFKNAKEALLEANPDDYLANYLNVDFVKEHVRVLERLVAGVGTAQDRKAVNKILEGSSCELNTPFDYTPQTIAFVKNSASYKKLHEACASADVDARVVICESPAGASKMVVQVDLSKPYDTSPEAYCFDAQKQAKTPSLTLK